jgi:nitrate/TMAO reductase-like tetraheme cytochrome c subunit
MLWGTCVAGDDDWQIQSYKQSKRLPDLHHAVDIKLLDPMTPPKSFVLKTGHLLQCKTCHGLEKMDEIPYDKVNKNDPAFLRGGPYRNFEAFCYQCHSKKDNEQPNIHVMLEKNGDIKKQNCLYCHEEVNEQRDKPREQSALKLRLPIEDVCLGCHLKTPHLNALEHQEAKPKDEMKKHMKAEAQKHGIILPLANSGKVICVSCHTPHPDGVINGKKNPAGTQVKGDVEKGVEYSKHSWNLIYQADKQERLAMLGLLNEEFYELPYQRIKSEVLLRLPAKDGELCLSCHEFER